MSYRTSSGGPRDRMTRRSRLSSSAIVLTIVAAASGVWWELLGRYQAVTEGASEIPWVVFLYSGSLVTAFLAGGLATALVLRGGRRDSHALALFLAASAFASLMILASMLWVSGDPDPAGRFGFLVPAAMVLACAALIRFAVLFPRPLAPAELARLGAVEPDDSLQRVENAFWRRFSGRSTEGATTKARHIERFVAALPERVRPFATVTVVRESGRLLTDARYFWGIAAGVALMPYVLWYVFEVVPGGRVGSAWSWLGIGLFFLWISLLFLGVLLAVAILRLGYALADTNDRRRVRWIVESLNAAAWGAIATAPLFVLEVLGVEHPLVELLPGILWGILPVLVVAGFAVATFYGGALEPSLVIRRGTLYGVFAIAIAFLFAVVEELVAEHVATRLGLPDGTGTLTASAAVAVAFGAFVGRFHRRVEAFLQEDPRTSAAARGAEESRPGPTAAP